MATLSPRNLARATTKHLVDATLFRRGRRRLHRAILRALSGCATIIDVAAGDDRLYLRLARHPGVRWILLNDVDIDALRRGAVVQPNVSRLCADALALDGLRFRFDGALVKNILHHLADERAISRVLAVARRLARRVVVVEIEDPRESLVPALLHRLYYRGLLAEQDNEDLFFDHVTQRSIIRRAWPASSITISRIPTVRGTYSVFAADFEEVC